jgi:hypothetical protein
MKGFVFLAAMMLGGFPAGAQIAATLKQPPNGWAEVTIRNNSANSLLAFAISAKRADGGSAALYFDPLVEESNIPILAGAERVVTLTASGWSEPVAAAGIFADGATTGDPVLLSRLLLRRSNMLLAVEMTLETLSDAGRRNVSRDQLMDQFKKMVNSARRWYLPREQQVGLGVYESIIGKLMSLQEGPLGTPFPPTAFVEEETAKLRQRRLALSESQPSLVDPNAASSTVFGPPSPGMLRPVFPIAPKSKLRR